MYLLTEQVSNDLEQRNGSQASSSQPSPKPNIACRETKHVAHVTRVSPSTYRN
jgi:hypothetical protein